ncbi:MAG: hypothetical protein ACFFFG_03915 [Candidatus Thorarchaeota archaeon]
MKPSRGGQVKILYDADTFEEVKVHRVVSKILPRYSWHSSTRGNFFVNDPAGWSARSSLYQGVPAEEDPLQGPITQLYQGYS